MPWSKRKINAEAHKSWLNYECEKREVGEEEKGEKSERKRFKEEKIPSHKRSTVKEYKGQRRRRKG